MLSEVILDSLTEGQRLSVEEPLDLHVWVSDRRQLTLELGRLHLHQVRLLRDLCHEKVITDLATNLGLDGATCVYCYYLSDEPRRLPLLHVVDVLLRQEDLLWGDSLVKFSGFEFRFESHFGEFGPEFSCKFGQIFQKYYQNPNLNPQNLTN